MKPDLADKLKNDFPKLYSHQLRRVITCDDGWEPVVRVLSGKLEPLGVVATQVKEKFGGLRFYVEFPPGISKSARDEVYALISAAEYAAGAICEFCGQPGELVRATGGRRCVTSTRLDR